MRDLLTQNDTCTVWLADDVTLGRPVVVRVLPALPPNILRAFHLLRRDLARLTLHPRLVTVHDGGVTVDGLPFLVEQFAPGGPIGARTPGPGGTLGLLRDVLEGLSHAHAAGMVHGNLTTSRILLDDQGRALVAEVGIHPLLERQSQTGLTNGDLVHLAPEILDGTPRSTASDIHAVGVLAHDLFLRPPAGPQPSEQGQTLSSGTSDAPLDLSLIPQPVRPWLTGLLAPTPAGRPSADEAIRAMPLDPGQTLVSPYAIQRPAGDTAPGRPRRRWVLSGAIALVPVVAVLAVIAATRLTPQSTQDQVAATPTSLVPTTPTADPGPAMHGEPDPGRMDVATGIVDGIHWSRLGLDPTDEPFSPLIDDRDAWVSMTSGHEGDRVILLDALTLAPLTSTPMPGVAGEPATIDAVVIVGFLQDGEQGIVGLQASADRHTVTEIIRLQDPGEREGVPFSPTWVGPHLGSVHGQPRGNVMVPHPTSIYALFATELADVGLPTSGPVVAVDTPSGPVGWVTYASRGGDGGSAIQRLPVETTPPVWLELGEGAGTRLEVLHVAEDGSVWFASRERTVTRIDGDSGTVTGSLAAGPCPVEDPLIGCRLLPPSGHGLIAHGSFWLGNRADGSLYRIDLDTMAISATIPLGPGTDPGTPVATNGAVWVADAARGVVHRIDVATNAIAASVQLPCLDAPCGAWPRALDWRHRAITDGDTIWLPWQGAVFRLDSGGT